MLPESFHLAGLIRTFEVTGQRYIARSLAEAMKSTRTAEGSTASDIAETAAAKADWDAAEQALTEYEVSRQ